MAESFEDFEKEYNQARAETGAAAVSTEVLRKRYEEFEAARAFLGGTAEVAIAKDGKIVFRKPKVT